MAQDVLPHIAERYRVSEHAVRELHRALQSTGGRQAQFDHPDLGGRGQWMPGMIMISSSFDPLLKSRIEGLCAELSAIVQGSETSADAALARPENTGAASACSPLAAGESWWPAVFGSPSAEGDQNGVRYAYFPHHDRLLLQQAGRIDAYDTTGRRITGFAQRQSTASSICFTTDRGDLRLGELQCVPIVPDAPRG